MPITLNGDTGITTPTYGGANTAEYLVPVTAFKNRIINGAMVIDQRNAGASVTLNGNLFGVDRWGTQASQNSKATMQRTTGVPAGFSYSLNFTSSSAYSPTASDYFWVYQAIEGFNIADFNWGTANAKTVTLSFWVYASLTGTYSVALNNGSRSYVTTYVVNSANTWEYKTITIAGDTSGTWSITNTNGVFVQFDLGCGSSRTTSTLNAWQAGDFQKASGSVSLVSNNGAQTNITGVQLEVGSTATSFDYRPYGTELALCQRYYWQSQATAANWNNLGAGFNFSTTNSMIFVNYPIQMRSAPTVSTFGTINTTNVQILVQGGATGASAVAGVGASETNALTTRVDFTSAGVTAGNGCIVRFAPNTGVTFSSEM